MNQAVLRTDCTAHSTISSEIQRLVDLGYRAAGHVDVTQLRPKEYFIYSPERSVPGNGYFSIYYREG